MAQHMLRIETTAGKTKGGYTTQSARYRAQHCLGCPLREQCYKSKNDKRTIEVNHRLNSYKRQAKEKLLSQEGIKQRGRRCIEPEAVFGQMKYNMAYKRFRHVGKDKITMDFTFFAMAFNLKKLCAKLLKEGINGFFSALLPQETRNHVPFYLFPVQREILRERKAA